MALSLAYINEVLNNLPCHVLVDEQVWPELLKALKFEGRALEDLVLGQMRLRWAPGGYEGLLQRLATLTQERDELRKEVEALQAVKGEAEGVHEPAREPEAVATS